MRGRLLRALFPALVAAAFVAASAHATECGRNGEGFDAWLKSFRQVAINDGAFRPRSRTPRSPGLAYDPSVKSHDGGAAAFGHDFETCGARQSTASGAGSRRGRAALGGCVRRPAGEDRAALRRSRTGAGGDWGLKRVLAATTGRFRHSGRLPRWPGIAAARSGFAPS